MEVHITCPAHRLFVWFALLDISSFRSTLPYASEPLILRAEVTCLSYGRKLSIGLYQLITRISVANIFLKCHVGRFLLWREWFKGAITRFVLHLDVLLQSRLELSLLEAVWIDHVGLPFNRDEFIEIRHWHWCRIRPLEGSELWIVKHDGLDLFNFLVNLL